MQDFNCFLSTFYRNILDGFGIYCRRGDDMLDLISGALLVGSMYTAYEVIDRIDLGEIISSKFRTYTDYDLIVGYQRKMGFKIPIVCNMKLCPHLLVCGLSGQGKSKCVEYAMRGKDCVLLNAYEDDMTSLKCPRITGNEAMLKYLNNVLEKGIKREKPFYIVVDECLVLASDKRLSRCLLDILSIGRHLNTYLVAISQRGTKQDLGYKDLFNSRLVFKMLESSAYSATLGTTVDCDLKFREFLLHSDGIYKGKSYNV